MSPKISLIVPCYNVEKYLLNCFESIERQTFRDFEVIFINDASTDKTKVLLQEYIKDRVYAKYFEHDINKGLGEAHNTGINNATGEFITFYDPDDVLHPRFLEMLYETINKCDADMAICNFKRVFTGNPRRFRNISISKKYDIIEPQGKVIDALFSLDEYLSWMDWNKIYRAKIIRENNINFGSLRWADDAYFNTTYCLYVNKAVLNHSVLYYYVQHRGSLCYSSFKKTYFQPYKYLIELLKNNYSERLELNMRKYFAYITAYAMVRASLSRYKNKADYKKLNYMLSQDLKWLKKHSIKRVTYFYLSFLHGVFKIKIACMRDRGDSLSKDLNFDYPIVLK